MAQGLARGFRSYLPHHDSPGAAHVRPFHFRGAARRSRRQISPDGRSCVSGVGLSPTGDIRAHRLACGHLNSAVLRECSRTAEAQVAVNLHPLVSPVARMLTLGRVFSGWSLSSMFEPGKSSHDGIDSYVNTAANDDCRRSMRSVLETQIIQRLVLAHREGISRAEPSASPRLLPADITTFAKLCAAADRAGAMQVIDQLRAQGLDQDGVLVDLISPAARHLGAQWEDDRL